MPPTPSNAMIQPTPEQLQRAAQTLQAGGIVAYPTEAVYGLGCDPWNETAMRRLLTLKQRPAEMGVILIASRIEQLEPFITPLDEATLTKLQATWPGPVTWIVPARAETPAWLRGAHTTIAVRVTAHPIAAALCEAAQSALVSTSANRTGEPPARDADAVRHVFGDTVDYILSGEVGGLDRPTEIRDVRTGEVIRPA